jgi:hypothetical protein
MLFSQLLLASLLIAQAPPSAPKADPAASTSSDQPASTPAKKDAARSKASASKETTAEVKAAREATINHRKAMKQSRAKGRAQAQSELDKALAAEQERERCWVEQARKDALVQMQALGVQAALAQAQAAFQQAQATRDLVGIESARYQLDLMRLWNQQSGNTVPQNVTSLPTVVSNSGNRNPGPNQPNPTGQPNTTGAGPGGTVPPTQTTHPGAVSGRTTGPPTHHTEAKTEVKAGHDAEKPRP